MISVSLSMEWSKGLWNSIPIFGGGYSVEVITYIYGIIHLRRGYWLPYHFPDPYCSPGCLLISRLNSSCNIPCRCAAIRSSVILLMFNFKPILVRKSQTRHGKRSPSHWHNSLWLTRSSGRVHFRKCCTKFTRAVMKARLNWWFNWKFVLVL